MGRVTVSTHAQHHQHTHIEKERERERERQREREINCSEETEYVFFSGFVVKNEIRNTSIYTRHFSVCSLVFITSNEEKKQ